MGSLPSCLRWAAASAVGLVYDLETFQVRWPRVLLVCSVVLGICWYRYGRIAKVYCVQLQATGNTGGCETKFLQDVSKHLSHQAASLKVTAFAETSRDLLLVFCPIASRMGSDIENALEGLSGVQQRAVLVVMHYLQRDNTEDLVDHRQVKHPALAQTVHARYTLQDGFYPCKMNEVAVAEVAAAIVDLA